MTFFRRLIDAFKVENTKEMTLSEARKKLERCSNLANIINQTTDREVFYSKISEIKEILMELSKYEHEIPFVSPPSKQLENLEKIEDEQIQLLEKRIAKKEYSKNNIAKYNHSGYYKNISREKGNNLHIAHTRECNTYTIREERKERQRQEQNQLSLPPVFSSAVQVNQKAQNYDNMNGHDFEYFCAGVIKRNGFVNVEVTQGSGDHGIDILAEKDDITYAIQCKCYSSNIGNAAVQQAYTGKGFYHKDIAVVLTNRYFTAQAKEEAQALGVKLWDRDKLNSMLSRRGGSN